MLRMICTISQLVQKVLDWSVLYKIQIRSARFLIFNNQNRYEPMKNAQYTIDTIDTIVSL